MMEKISIGWQKQPDKLNIQGTIEQAIEAITGEKVELNHSLKNGDIVEIKFQKDTYGPIRDLASMCHTNKAKRKIREFNNRWLKKM